MKHQFGLVALLCAVLVMSGCQNKNEPTITFIENPTVEYGNLTIAPTDFVRWGNWDTMTSTELDVYSPGLQTLTYSLTKGSSTKKIDLTISVVDTQFPTFSKRADQIILDQGSQLEIKNSFTATDPVDGEVDVQLDVAVDTSVAGSHSREVVATDKNGNQTKLPVMIIVQPKTEIQPADPGNNSSAGSGSGSSSGTGETPGNPPATKPSLPAPANKDFLFVDGYTMSTVSSACETYLLASVAPGYKGICIQLEKNGVVTGLRAQFTPLY